MTRGARHNLDRCSHGIVAGVTGQSICTACERTLTYIRAFDSTSSSHPFKRLRLTLRTGLRATHYLR